MIGKIKEIVKEAGTILLNADRRLLDVKEKTGNKDFVTHYDMAIQKMLEEKLLVLLPEAGFFGEESDGDRFVRTGYCFIVDPIDGTANFVCDYRHSCISVGLTHQGAVIMGAVYDPYLDELFWAEKGQGAYLNQQKITVSMHGLQKGLVLFGTSPYDRTKTKETFQIAQVLFEKSLDVRRSGSAALDLCYVAAGRCSLFYELGLSPWDFAAGSLIVEEAGGMVLTLEHTPLVFDCKTSVLAAGKTAYDDYVKLMNEHKWQQRS